MKIPYHLALIIDGNRRWAKEKGCSVYEGHKKGLENLEKIGDYALEKGVKILTVYAFSNENWKRVKTEVNFLMKLLFNSLTNKSLQRIHKKGIKLKIIGEKSKLSKELRKKIREAEALTKDNTKGVLNLAVSYSGRMEILQAVKRIIKEELPVTEKSFRNCLYTGEMPYPDLVIRTGGEKRLSNFLTWQSAYSELYFTEKKWPAFTEEALDEAFKEYANRERRFGK